MDESQESVQSSHIFDESSLRKYRTEIPNTVVRGIKGRRLSIYAKWLYVYFKSVIGNDGVCFRSTTTIAIEAGMSRGQVSEAKKELALSQLITIKQGKNPRRDVDHIRIKDIWLANMQEFSVHNTNTEEEPYSYDFQHNTLSSVHNTNTENNVQCSQYEHSVHTVNQRRTLLRSKPREEKNKDRSAMPQKTDTAYSPGFLNFWKLYPEKKAKGDVWKIWKRLNLEPLAEQICVSVINHLQHDPQWRKGYIKYPATYLNGACWEDEFEQSSPPRVHKGKFTQ